MALTLADMRDEIGENLMLAGLERPSNSKRILRALNRAKNDVVAILEARDPSRYTYRKDYSVASGDTYLTLPDGSTPGEPKFRRLLQTSVVEGGEEWPINTYTPQDPSQRSPSAWPYTGWGMYLEIEKDKLYFPLESGSPRAMTLRLRYAGEIPDLDGSDATESFDYISDEWADVMVMQATVDLIPAANPERNKWIGRVSDRIEKLIPAAQQINRPLMVRRVW